MTNVVPLSPAPAWYAHAAWTKPHGVFYVGDTIVSTWNKSGFTSYVVYDYSGTLVSSGSLSGSVSTFNPTAPVGGWNLGWYRIEVFGPNSDALFGTCYGASSFSVIADHPNFITIPNVSAPQPSFDGGWDAPMTGPMGIGTSRLQIDHANAPATGEFTLSAIEGLVTNYFVPYWTNPGSQYLDPARPRDLWVSFPNGTVDAAQIPATVGTYLWCFCKDGTLDGSQVFVACTPGAGTACTITVAAPTSGTVVETWSVTSAANAVTQINAGSNYIRVFVPSTGAGATPSSLVATAIGNVYFQGVITCVTALVPLGVSIFEGPRNEPVGSAGETAQQCRLFAAAVHQVGGAQAMGPGFVSIRNESANDQWAAFLAAGGASAGLDIYSTHMYNAMPNGDLTCGRNVIGSWIRLLETYGIDTEQRWQTESTWSATAVNSVHYPRRSGKGMMMTLLLEEFGIPREHNPWWYILSHGFWSVEAFLETIDGALEPVAVLFRTLAEETWAMNFAAKFNLPQSADRFLLAHRYSGAAGAVAIFQLTSDIPGATVTLATSASSLVVRDGLGNITTYPASGGLITIPVADIPTFVRIPNGETLNVYTVLGWPRTEKTLLDATRKVTISGTLTPFVTDSRFLYSWEDWSSTYPVGGGMVAGTAGMPDAAVFTFGATQSIRRLIVFSGIGQQKAGTLLTFTVETSVDGGSNWTTQQTVDTSATATTFAAAADSFNLGTQLESFWPSQYVFPIDLGGPISCNAVRLSVSAASYGGDANSAAYAVNGNATGWGTPQIVLQQVLFRG